MMSAGPSRNPPAARSRIEANTLGESIRGRQSHSTLPLGATRAVVSQSDRKAYWPMRGNGESPPTHACGGRGAAWSSSRPEPSPRIGLVSLAPGASRRHPAERHRLRTGIDNPRGRLPVGACRGYSPVIQPAPEVGLRMVAGELRPRARKEAPAHRLTAAGPHGKPPEIGRAHV